ncbi:hypothetical protein AHAS_Ahas05G0058100 [Arachis hypogaea]
MATSSSARPEPFPPNAPNVDPGVLLLGSKSKQIWEGHEFQYQDELAKLVVSLERFFRFDVPAQTSRDTKETLLKIIRILSVVRKLPLARTESATGSASNLDSMPLESNVCGTLPLQLNDEKERELDSTEESAELEHLAKPILEDIASLVQKGSQAEAEIHKGHQDLQSKHEGSGRLRSSIEFFGSRMDFTDSDSIVFNENNLIAEDISKLEDAFKQLLSFFRQSEPCQRDSFVGRYIVALLLLMILEQHICVSPSHLGVSNTVDLDDLVVQKYPVAENAFEFQESLVEALYGLSIWDRLKALDFQKIAAASITRAVASRFCRNRHISSPFYVEFRRRRYVHLRHHYLRSRSFSIISARANYSFKVSF